MVEPQGANRIALRPDYETKPLTVRIRDACRMTGIGRSKLYELIGDGEIETIKIGAITLIRVDGLEDFLQRQKCGPR